MIIVSSIAMSPIVCPAISVSLMTVRWGANSQCHPTLEYKCLFAPESTLLKIGTS